MTKIVFDGAEVPSNRLLLIGAGAEAVSLSFYRLRKRGLPKNKPYLLAEKYPEGVSVFVDSGWKQVEESDMSGSEVEEYAADYDDFLANNGERLAGATELYLPKKMGNKWIAEQRLAHESMTGQLLIPVWTHAQGQPYLFTLAEQYNNIAIPNDSVEAETTLASRIRAIKQSRGTEFHALAMAKPDNLRSIPFATATTMSWLSPMMRGETIVWDGTRLVRYPKRMKAQARPRYRHVIEKAGLDYDKIVGDDLNEVARLAIWSYQQLERSMKKPENNPFTVIEGGLDDTKLPSNSGFVDDPGFAETLGVELGNSAIEVRKVTKNEVAPRDPSEKQNMPVLGFDYKTIVDTDENGKDVLKTVPVVSSNAESMRQCNTCFIASNCPAMKPDSVCAFNLPVEVKTKDQLRSLLNAIVEMQGQRVAFMRFAEEANGGYADPNTSQEIDRLFKLVKTMNELEQNREFIRITAERQSSGGMLSAIFGDRAQALRELPNGGLDADQTNKIIDAQIVE